VGRTSHLSHFYFGNDPARWRTHVPGYEGVRLTSLWPGIDLEYHGSGRELEYDFLLAPGADPRRIRVHYDGIQRLRVTAQGELEVTTRFGRTLEAAPIAYQVIDGERRAVAAQDLPRGPHHREDHSRSSRPVRCRKTLSSPGVTSSRSRTATPAPSSPASKAGMTLAGCAGDTSLGKKIDYKSVASAPALELPPDLTAPQYDDRYNVATASGVAARDATRPRGGGDIAINEYKASISNPNVADLSTRRRIITIEHSANSNHKVVRISRCRGSV